MNFIDWISRKTYKPEEPEQKPIRKRGFNAGSTGRLFSDWVTQPLTIDTELYNSSKKLRARSRDLSINNEFARKYLKSITYNVVGKTGLVLQARFKDSRGNLDTFDNATIEKAFKQWSDDCCVTGNLTFNDSLQIIVETLARDGEIFIRLVKGYRGNKFRFGIQLIEADYIDEDKNGILQNGNTVRFGIEKDQWGKAVAYYVLKNHPSFSAFQEQVYTETERIPADQMIHVFMPERPGQTRGFPWMSASMSVLRHLGAFRESEVIAARVSAGKMGFFSSTDGDSFIGDDYEDDYTPIMEAEPGTFQQLPANTTFQSWNPDHPNSNYKDFEKQMLKGFASGVNVSYFTIGNDLEAVNYSSARVGLLEDRAYFKTIQNFLMKLVCARIYKQWLEMFLTLPTTILPARQFEKYLEVSWITPGWTWIDPLKEVNSNIQAVKSGFKTHSEVLAEQGLDFEETMNKIKFEQEMIKKFGVELNAIYDQEGMPDEEAKQD